MTSATNYTLNIDELISKFPKVIEDVKIGKFKSINQIVGSVLKNDPTIDAKDLYNKIYFNLVGTEVPEKIVKEIPEKPDVLRLESINKSYKIGNDYYLKVLYKVDEEVVDFNKLTELQLTKPNVLKVRQILDSLIIKT